MPALDKLLDSYAVSMTAFCLNIGIAASNDLELNGSLYDATNGIVEPEEPALLAAALAGDINLRVLDDLLEEMKIAGKIASGAKYPSLAGFFNYNLDYKKENMYVDERSWVNGWNCGLNLTVPVDGWLPFSKTAGVEAEADANIQKAAALRAQAVDEVRLTVKTLMVQMKETKLLMGRYASTEAKAKRAYELSEDRYNTGIASSVEVTDSEMQYTEVYSAYLQALYDYTATWNRITRYY
jgi:hypothetical protein